MIRSSFTLTPLALLVAGACLPLRAAETGTTLPPVTVSGTTTGALSEEDFVGPYAQPEWTEHRRFTTTRVYLQQEPGDVGFEQWWRARAYNGEPAAHRFIEEVEIGLPGRFQLDLYYNWAHTDYTTHFDEASVELRYALADWGKLPLNPTLYVEYAFVNHDYGGDTLEWKLLLGDDIGKRWHYGINFVYEGELSHERAQEFSATFGLSYTLIDQVLGVGVEAQYKHETVAGDRSNPEIQMEVGPSVQWRPSKNTHVDVVALFGTTNQGPRVESFLIFGWDFGGGNGGDPHYKPTSGFHN